MTASVHGLPIWRVRSPSAHLQHRRSTLRSPICLLTSIYAKGLIRSSQLLIMTQSWVHNANLEHTLAAIAFATLSCHSKAAAETCSSPTMTAQKTRRSSTTQPEATRRFENRPQRTDTTAQMAQIPGLQTHTAEPILPMRALRTRGWKPARQTLVPMTRALKQIRASLRAIRRNSLPSASLSAHQPRAKATEAKPSHTGRSRRGSGRWAVNDCSISTREPTPNR